MPIFNKDTYATMLKSYRVVKSNQNKAEALLAYKDLFPGLKDSINEVIELLKYKVGPTKDKEADRIDNDISKLLDRAAEVFDNGKGNVEESMKDILLDIKTYVFARQRFSK